MFLDAECEDRHHDLHTTRHGGDTQQEEDLLLVLAELPQGLHDLIKLHLVVRSCLNIVVCVLLLLFFECFFGI